MYNDVERRSASHASVTENENLNKDSVRMATFVQSDDDVIGYNDGYNVCSIHLFIATSTDRGRSFEGVIITENGAINSLYRMSIV